MFGWLRLKLHNVQKPFFISVHCIKPHLHWHLRSAKTSDISPLIYPIANSRYPGRKSQSQDMNWQWKAMTYHEMPYLRQWPTMKCKWYSISKVMACLWWKTLRCLWQKNSEVFIKSKMSMLARLFCSKGRTTKVRVSRTSTLANICHQIFGLLLTEI